MVVCYRKGTMGAVAADLYHFEERWPCVFTPNLFYLFFHTSPHASPHSPPAYAEYKVTLAEKLKQELMYISKTMVVE